MNNEKYTCSKCNKLYSSYKSLWNHTKKFHDNLNELNNNLNEVNNKKYLCKYCNRQFNFYNNRWKHQKICKLNSDFITINKTELEALKNVNNKQYEDKIKKYEEIINKLSLPINNQLINIIENKNKKIEELNSNLENNKVILNKQIKTTETLTLNNIVIISRSEDNYINATQLCQAGGKQFNDWFRLNTTKQLIDALKSKTGIPVLDLIEINKGGLHLGSWVHPDLAIQLAQWISPMFALQVSSWIRTLFTTGNVSIDVKLLEDKENELKLKDNKIKLLENIYLKKHKRVNYPERNVIYILTTEDNKKKRNYIIGKAINLTNRLSVYNKTAEHEVVYYKECKSEENMNAIEVMVLLKLRNYQEKANRDRFILPLEKDISLFTNIIDECINFIKNI